MGVKSGSDLYEAHKAQILMQLLHKDQRNGEERKGRTLAEKFCTLAASSSH
jgi:hypothetical protein